jgi:ribosomal protein S24E
MTIKNQKENPLLNRKEIIAEIVFTGATPSREVIKNDIASQLKCHADVVEIKEIRTEFGNQKAKATIYVYKDTASKKEMVELNKKQLEKAKKAEEAKKEAK